MISIEMPDQTVITSREEKLNRLITLYGTSLLRTCYVLLKDASMAEDATQESLIKAYNNLDTFTPRDALSEKAWLMRIAVNTCKDLRRSAWYRNVDRRLDICKALESKQSSTDEDTLLQDVLSLPLKYRDVLFFHYYQGFDIREIGMINNERSETIYKRLQRARQMLRVQLERGEDNE